LISRCLAILRQVPSGHLGNRTFRSNPFCDLVNSDEQFSLLLQLKRIVERKRATAHATFQMADMRLANQCIGLSGTPLAAKASTALPFPRFPC